MNNTKSNNELTMPQRFTNRVVKSYMDIAPGIEVTKKQLQLISNYYIKLDEMIKRTDTKIEHWQQVRISELSTTLAHMARLNLDMALGHLSFVPFRHKNSNTFDLVPVISAKGYEYIAKSYGIESPKHYIVELVYSTDSFQVIKRDVSHMCDSYIFEITDPFKRGDIIGGFGYIEFEDSSKNFILPMSKEDILKYRPPQSTDSFWTGENGKKMYEKTIAKQLFKRVTLDPDKVNTIQNSFKCIESQEINYTSSESQQMINENMGVSDMVDI